MDHAPPTVCGYWLRFFLDNRLPGNDEEYLASKQQNIEVLHDEQLIMNFFVD